VRSLTTLGALALEGTTLARTKPLVLLAYLALSGPTPRRRMQELFWPGAQGAGNSLRVALHMLRETADDLIGGSDVLEARLECDAALLLSDTDPASTFSRYTGPFLHGVVLPGISDELEEWIVETGERVAAAAQQAGLLAAEASRVPAQRQRLAEAAYRLVGAPPPMPAELRRLSELLSPGSPAQREVDAELASFGDVPLAPPVLALAGLVPAGLIGRGREIGELLSLLGPQAVRLTEVTGPGGIGKTTLVDAALREHAALSGARIASVDAEMLGHGAEVAAQVAAALKLPLNDQGDIWRALGQALGSQPTVIALHGVEHLPPLGESVGRLLAHAPGLQVILTTRRRTTDGAHLHLEGLAQPPGGSDPALIRASPAVQLFVREARRSGAALDPAGPDGAVIASIVRRLDGHPLALTLAASLLSGVLLSTLHEQVLRDMALPHDAQWHDLRALFDRSWSLLELEEQLALAHLVPFADFTPADALAAAGVSAAQLGRLEAHSLLRRRDDRYQVLPVLAPLVPGSDPGAARAAHARHYLEILGELGPEDPRLVAERRNVALAAEYAVQTGTAQSVLIDALLSAYDLSGQLSAGSEEFARLAELMEGVDTSPAVRASILIGQAWLAHRSARSRDAERLARRLLDDPAMSEPQVRMKALNVRAVALDHLGRTIEALPVLREAIELAYRSGNDDRAARYAENLGAYANAVGDFEEGERVLLEVIAIHARSGLDMQVLSGRLHLLNIRVDQRFTRSAEQLGSLLEEARVLEGAFELSGVTQHAAMSQLLQARLLVPYRPADALRVARLAVQNSHNRGFETFEAAALLVCGEALYALGRSPEARQSVTHGLIITLRNGDVMGMIEAWLVVAADLADLQPELAHDILMAAAHDRRADAIQRQRAMQLGASQSIASYGQDGRYDAQTLSASVLKALQG
jgi:tetratricopeptide (TPR) repeat protein